jgi:hypothetical protein
VFSFLADRIAAENLFLDQSKERRREEIGALVAKAGTCSMPDRFDYVENALRGRWTLTCERGSLEIAVTLAPTIPPAVQYLSVRPGAARSDGSGPCVSF